MACLYICRGAFDEKWVLKFGISKYDRPSARLHGHNNSKDNPFGTSIRLYSLSWFTCADIKGARRLEQAITAHSKKLPHVHPYGPVSELSVPCCCGPRDNPSGEWLVAPFCDCKTCGAAAAYNLAFRSLAQVDRLACNTVFTAYKWFLEGHWPIDFDLTIGQHPAVQEGAC